MQVLINKQLKDNEMPFKVKDLKEKNISNEKTKKTEGEKSSNSNKEKIPTLYEMKEKMKNIKMFENFELKNYVDSGSESNVFKIQNKKNKKEYALKVIKHRKNKDANMNELKIAFKLKHPKIIDLNGYFLQKKGDDNSQYILMENAKYGNLRNFLLEVLKIKRCLSESMICFLARQILEGLDYLHRCRIAHMDIKPQNIVIDDYLNAKLIDFSISINCKNKNPHDKIKLPYKGTAFYMSPEVYNSDYIEYKDINKVDLYALGVVLFNLAFGSYPYDLKNGDEDNEKIIKEKLESELKIKNENKFSLYFIDFISRLLERDINKRMNLNEAIQHPWIKGANFLYEEKENMNNLSSYVAKLLTNSIIKFNEYLKNS